MVEFDRKARRSFQKVYGTHFSLRSLAVCLSFFVFLLFVSSDRKFSAGGPFRPILKVSSLSLFQSRLVRDNAPRSLAVPVIRARVLFPDHLMLILASKVASTARIQCVYKDLDAGDVVVRHADYNGDLIVGCPIPPAKFSPGLEVTDEGKTVEYVGVGEVVPWDSLVYEAVLDGNTAVVFVKGLNLRPHTEADSRRFRCHFGEGSEFSTRAVSAAQEVLRCLLPRSIREAPEKAVGWRVSVSRGGVVLPTVAEVRYVEGRGSGKYELCGCTMVWNQAAFMKEWVTYHRWLGVERWFVYDNNSDDALLEVIDELNKEGSNISRRVWPWTKAQEGGFSHCVLRARAECKWVGFFDVDEFFFFPRRRGQELPGKGSLGKLVAKYTNSPTIGEIRTVCYSYGPSGLSEVPSQGVTSGYTCRVQAPERHKSIVRPDRVDGTLLNAVHHFKLRQGYRYLNLPESTAVVNHYKYQVWDTFKSKFYRRVSTYVSNWQEEENKGSKDRVPGLGTVAVEPRDWRFSFCEVWDTGLRDFVYANFGDPATGGFPWERRSLVA